MPWFGCIALSEKMPNEDIQAWIRAHGLSQSYMQQIQTYWQPLAAHIARQKQDAPLLLGIQGVQGAGKSLLANCLAMLLGHDGYEVGILSLDDLYLSRQARAKLAADVHPLFQMRGVPATHDVALGMALLRDIQAGKSGICLPRFDKASDNPKPTSLWHKHDAPIDILLFEGWCVGVEAQNEPALDAPVNRLEAEQDSDGTWRRYANRQLAGQYAELFAMLDKLIALQAPDFACVYSWRMRQEQQLGTQGMREADLRWFIQHFERISRHALRTMPQKADILFCLDEQQSVRSVQGLA